MVEMKAELLHKESEYCTLIHQAIRQNYLNVAPCLLDGDRSNCLPTWLPYQLYETVIYQMCVIFSLLWTNETKQKTDQWRFKADHNNWRAKTVKSENELRMRKWENLWVDEYSVTLISNKVIKRHLWKKHAWTEDRPRENIWSEQWHIRVAADK